MSKKFSSEEEMIQTLYEKNIEDLPILELEMPTPVNTDLLQSEESLPFEEPIFDHVDPITPEDFDAAESIDKSEEIPATPTLDDQIEKMMQKRELERKQQESSQKTDSKTNSKVKSK